MNQAFRPILASVVAALAVTPLLSGCDSGGTARGPQPATSFAFDDDDSPGLTNLGGALVMRSCAFAVRDENKDRYVADGQASTNPSPSTIQVIFIDTKLTTPAAGDLSVPTQAFVKATLPSPYGVLEGTGGTVKLTEVDGWRIVELKNVAASGTRYSGILTATLACGM